MLQLEMRDKIYQILVTRNRVNDSHYFDDFFGGDKSQLP